MTPLSQQLKGITSRIRQTAQQQQQAGQAANVFQTQQALTEVARQPQPTDATALAQQMAPTITQAQGQVALQAQQERGQQELQAGQAAVTQQQRQANLALQNRQRATELEIAQKQREGKLRQNSSELELSKKLQTRELAEQKRMQQTGFYFDNRISFLTRKQREDLAASDRFLKNQLFDSRLQFKQAEAERKFSNARQLADYVILSHEDGLATKKKLQEMTLAYQRDQVIMEAAYAKISQALEQEFQKSEQQASQAQKKKLLELKQAMEQRMREKKRQANKMTNMITGVVKVGAGVAVAAASSWTGVGAAAGATIAAGGVGDLAATQA